MGPDHQISRTSIFTEFEKLRGFLKFSFFSISLTNTNKAGLSCYSGINIIKSKLHFSSMDVASLFSRCIDTDSFSGKGICKYFYQWHWQTSGRYHTLLNPPFANINSAEIELSLEISENLGHMAVLAVRVPTRGKTPSVTIYHSTKCSRLVLGRAGRLAILLERRP